MSTPKLNALPRFQFTPLREGRHKFWDCYEVLAEISIHAPARGATKVKSAREAVQYFNSRPCERGDAQCKSRRKEGLQFQFTPLREGRLFRQRGAPDFFVFQFTPLREGRRTIADYFGIPTKDFNSRPCERGDGRGDGG